MSLQQLREFCLQYYYEDKLQELIEEAMQYFEDHTPAEAEWLAAEHVAEMILLDEGTVQEDAEADLQPDTPKAVDRVSLRTFD